MDDAESAKMQALIDHQNPLARYSNVFKDATYRGLREGNPRYGIYLSERRRLSQQEKSNKKRKKQ